MIKKSLLAIASLFSAVSACDCDINMKYESYLNGTKSMDRQAFDDMWAAFSKKEGLNSPNNLKGENHRMENFAKTIDSIIEHNKQGLSYSMGINQFSDMSAEEFKKHYNFKPQDCSATNHQSVSKPKQGKLPVSWDWREHKGVTPVKDQGSCGSCWTFSTVGTLEAHSMIKYGSFIPLSEQQLVDCAGDFDNQGCDGGLPSHAFEYIMYAGGISTEKSYPYSAKDHKCTVDPKTFELDVKGGSVNITQGDEVELAQALYHHGPVSVCFDVLDEFMNYKSGIYSSKKCGNGPQDVNHAVVAVGYGHEAGMDYWIVKNSWGPGWGEKGFFKIQRGNNMCGMGMCNSYPNSVVKLGSTQTFLQ